MGWSCTEEAEKTLERIFSLEGENGIIVDDGAQFAISVSDKEYDDGRIYVRVYVYLPVDWGMKATRIGAFYINPDGSINKNAIRRFPFLKQLF